MIFTQRDYRYYRIVSEGQRTFDCRLYCGRSPSMQGAHVKIVCEEKNASCLLLLRIRM